MNGLDGWMDGWVGGWIRICRREGGKKTDAKHQCLDGKEGRKEDGSR